MLDSSEMAAKVEALTALMERKRISHDMLVKYREKIAEIFDPLPSPWEWQQLRQLAGLSSIDMSGVSGISSNNIRRWEIGYGTNDSRQWVEYASALREATVSRLVEREAASIAVSNNSRDEERAENPSVVAHMRALQGASNSLEIWLGQEELPCNLQDVDVLWGSVQKVLRSLRLSEIKLRKKAQAGHIRKEVSS
jgi:DNA-binding transcriptional regulator YiaG